MGTLRLFCLSFLVLVLGSVFGQEPETIPWSADRKLTWEDFKGKPLKTEWAAATTASGISYEFSTSGPLDDLKVHFKVYTDFYPQKSWYRPKMCDSVILSHEQLHFDISELFARKMLKRLRETTFTKNVKAEVREIYRETLKSLTAFQNKYDHQTNFSRNVEQQRIWNKKISDALSTTELQPLE
ncbi:DUF922 domain-containing protein [Ulvibacterium sp.]|uniref:DUF922 domain-containing protein n=1 Tax=Ulvibacterium sp. TaxID=2665914 RepID=UPI0026389B2A|nr:DUF922 domain-containing protein [Ulvibacterium sp.]